MAFVNQAGQLLPEFETVTTREGRYIVNSAGKRKRFEPGARLVMRGGRIYIVHVNGSHSELLDDVRVKYPRQLSGITDEARRTMRQMATTITDRSAREMAVMRSLYATAGSPLTFSQYATVLRYKLMRQNLSGYWTWIDEQYALLQSGGAVSLPTWYGSAEPTNETTQVAVTTQPVVQSTTTQTAATVPATQTTGGTVYAITDGDRLAVPVVASIPLSSLDTRSTGGAGSGALPPSEGYDYPSMQSTIARTETQKASSAWLWGAAALLALLALGGR